MVNFRCAIIVLSIVQFSILHAQEIHFSSKFLPVGQRTISISSYSWVTPLNNPGSMDSIYLSETVRIESFNFDEQSGKATLLHLTVLEDEKSTTNIGGVDYIEGPVIGKDYFIRRTDTKSCVIYSEAGTTMSSGVKKYLSIEYNKYIWDEAIWGLLNGESFVIGEQYELSAEQVEKYLVRSFIDTLQGSVVLEMIGMKYDKNGKAIVELSLAYATGASSKLLESSGRHVLNIYIEYPSCRLVKLKEEYEKENYAPMIMEKYLSNVVEVVSVNRED